MHIGREHPSRHVTSRDRWVLALVRDAIARARLADALRGRAELRAVSTIAEAEAGLRAAGAAPIAAILEATDAAGQSAAGLSRALIHGRPPVPVIGYCVPGERQGREILEFARAGVHELMFRGIDDRGHDLERLLAGATHLCAADEIAARVAPLLPPRAGSFVAFCLRHPEITTVTAAAAALAIHRKTLFVHCADAHLPPPGILLGWARLLLAAHLIGTSHRTIEVIALDLEFASVNALRNMLKRYTGLRPGEVRAGGGVPVLMPHFRAALAGRRLTLPSARSQVA